MPFKWLDSFQQKTKKPTDYAKKTLAAYRLGMKAKGSITGVRIVIDAEGCSACQKLSPNAIYHPDEAPHLPLPECDKAQQCGCVYRPVMTYQLED